MYRKLKGRVLESTLDTILREVAVNIVNIPKEEEILYHTRKSVFIAKRVSVMYWNIFQVLGEVEVAT
jgi:hypothetical protein